MSDTPKVFTREFFQKQGAIGGKLGGVQAAKNMTAEQRSARAKDAVAARSWRPVKPPAGKKKTKSKRKKG